MFKLLIMKKVLLLLMFIPLITFGQELNKDSNGYSEVVEVELTKKEIHQKLNEWIVINYKSAKDVIQLNTEDKIIIKGNFLVNFSVAKYVFTYRIQNGLSFSVRDNKFKIDLVPNSASSDGVGDVDSSIFTQYLTDVAYTKDEFLKYSIDASMKLYLASGFSEKKAQKMVDKYIVNKDGKDDAYKSYIDNRLVWNNRIALTFTSIKDYVAKSDSDDDW